MRTKNLTGKDWLLSMEDKSAQWLAPPEANIAYLITFYIGDLAAGPLPVARMEITELTSRIHKTYANYLMEAKITTKAGCPVAAAHGKKPRALRGLTLGAGLLFCDSNRLTIFSVLCMQCSVSVIDVLKCDAPL